MLSASNSRRSERSLGKSDESRGRHGWHLLPLIALLLVPMTAIAAFTAAGLVVREKSTTPDQAETTKVGSIEMTNRQATEVRFSLDPAPEVIVAQAGTITEINVAPGVTVTQGQVLARVDDVPVRAIVGQSPLYRAIGPGSKGTDVLALSSFLGSLGYADADLATDVYTQKLALAIRAYESRELRRTPTGIFEATLVAFIPESSTVVRQVEVQLGSRVTDASSFMTMTPVPSSMSLVSASSGQQLRSFEGPVAMTIGSRVLDLPSSAPSPDLVATVYQAFAEEARTGSVTSAADGADSDVASFTGAFIELADPPRAGQSRRAPSLQAAQVACVSSSEAGPRLGISTQSL